MSKSASEFEEALRPGMDGPSPARMSVSVRVRDLVRIVLGWSIMLVGAAIVVTAFGTRTVRQYGEMGQWGATTATDGLRWFQGWALICVLGRGSC